MMPSTLKFLETVLVLNYSLLTRFKLGKRKINLLHFLHTRYILLYLEDLHRLFLVSFQVLKVWGYSPKTL